MLRMSQTRASFRQCAVHFSSAEGVWAGSQARGSLEDCEVHSNGTVGISVCDSACINIVNNKIFDNKAGVVISGTARPQIAGNNFSGHTLAAVHTLESADPVLEVIHLSCAFCGL